MPRGSNVPFRQLTAVLVALLVATAVSWAVSYAHVPAALGVTVALAIAGSKIVLVALFFMELAHHRGGLRVAAITAPLLVLVLVLFVLFDVWARRAA